MTSWGVFGAILPRCYLFRKQYYRRFTDSIVSGSHFMSTSSKTPRKAKKLAVKRAISLTDLKDYPYLCSAWTTCDQFVVPELVSEIVNRFPSSTSDCVPLDLDDQIVCIDNLVSESSRPKSSKNDLFTPRLFLFDFGCLVFWNVDSGIAREVRRLANEKHLQISSYDPSIVLQENDSIPYVEDPSKNLPKIHKDVIHFPSGLTMRDIVLYQFAYSNSLALSVKLGYWEIQVESLVRNLSPYISQMQTGVLNVREGDIMQLYGRLFNIDHKINLSKDFLELPEVYWNQPLLEEEFLSMRIYLSVKERVRIIGQKISQSFNLLEMLRSCLNETRSQRLEKLIVLLIALELLVTVLYSRDALRELLTGSFKSDEVSFTPKNSEMFE